MTSGVPKGIQIKVSANPAAGAAATLTVGTDEIWEVLAVHVNLAVADTAPLRLEAVRGSEVGILAVTPANGAVRRYVFSAGAGTVEGTNATLVGIPNDVFLLPSDVLRVVVTAGTADLDAMTATVRIWQSVTKG